MRIARLNTFTYWQLLLGSLDQNTEKNQMRHTHREIELRMLIDNLGNTTVYCRIKLNLILEEYGVKM